MRIRPSFVQMALTLITASLIYGFGGERFDVLARLVRAAPIQDITPASQHPNRDQFVKFKTGRRIQPGETQTTIEEPPIGHPGAGEPLWTDIIRDCFCTQDAVVSGVVSTSVSALTDDGSFVFTDYDFVVDEVFKGAGLASGSQIVVSRPGGTVHTRNGDITARLNTFAPLGIGDHYILFLHLVKDRGTFTTQAELSAFRIDGPSLHVLTTALRLPADFASATATDQVTGVLRSLAPVACPPAR